ncbi:MAG: hypothetical protein JXB13_01965 [Phycisphaerae bacterium]|nr:hypothetical protein [Phycisphaerae bacterium]
MAQELKIVADFHDFTLWLTRHVEKFPRHHVDDQGHEAQPGVAGVPRLANGPARPQATQNWI